jgi:hypothetical protein
MKFSFLYGDGRPPHRHRYVRARGLGVKGDPDPKGARIADAIGCHRFAAIVSHIIFILKYVISPCAIRFLASAVGIVRRW